MQKHCIISSSNICFGYLLELPLWGNSNKYPKHMFYEKIRIKPFLHIILSIKDSLEQQIHYNGNIFGNKCCRCNEGSLYVNAFQRMEIDARKLKMVINYNPNMIKIQFNIYHSASKFSRRQTDDIFPIFFFFFFFQNRIDFSCQIVSIITSISICHLLKIV